jgi:hypothetical protein
MADENPPQEAPTHCPKCDALPRLLVAIPDSERNRIVRLYRCPECNALIWVE